ncbi:MAG: glycyl-radical enzyme activating protein [Chloroflexi bacterium]|nr:glycyl-radical enzyme activating protein [Chloroflexota bacterium]
MMVAEERKGWVFNIQRYSVNDGPGIRTTVFFKGCPLHCLWCDNPESQGMTPEMLYLEPSCTRCHRCVATCPSGATRVGVNGALVIDWQLCQACGKCVESCLNEARAICGSLMSVSDVMAVVKKDSLFYRNSGGGVTVSGGEPLYQPEFLRGIFTSCQEQGIHTALETSGFAGWQAIEDIIEHTDLFLFDIKHTEPIRHRQLTGMDNGQILANLAKIVARQKSIILRVPLIPGCNDDRENLDGLARLAGRLKLTRIDLLPYHRLGVNKYRRLGRRYELESVTEFHEEELVSIKAHLESFGLEVCLA